MASTYAAYSVYYYDTQKVGHGMAGRITDTGSAITPHPDMATSLNGDPTVQGFVESSGALSIAVTDYTGSSGEPVRIYDATTTSSTPIATVSGGWSDVTNLYALAQVDDYLYALDFDNARVVEIDPSNNYAETGVSYTLASSFNPDPNTYTAHGQALLNINGTLYGLFTFAVAPYFTTYASTSLLVKFTIAGGSSISVGSTDYNSNFAPNAFAMAVRGSNLYVAAIGGEQGAGSYNTASRIQSIAYGTSNLSTATVNNVMSPSSTYPYNFLDISFNGSTAYVLMGAYNSSYTMNGVLLSTTDFINFTTIDAISAAAGYYWAAQYTSDNNRIWYGRGNPIRVYNASSTGTPVKELTISSGSLISSGESYNSLSNFSYVGASGSLVLRGYRSPIQVSRTPRAVRARAIAQGRPGLTKEELAQLDREFGTK
jgi:hypothetical protein